MPPMSLSGMNLVQLDRNYFVYVDTETTFEFLMNHDLSIQEADRRIYAYFRHWKETRPQDEFYGRPHHVPQTGYADPPR